MIQYRKNDNWGVLSIYSDPESIEKDIREEFEGVYVDIVDVNVNVLSVDEHLFLYTIFYAELI